MPASSSTPWLSQGEEKRTAVQEIFSAIAPVYDRMNGWMSLSRHHAWRSDAVKLLDLKPNSTVLDLCCGTGDFLFPIRKAAPDGLVMGIDFCAPMLEKSVEKAPFAHHSLGDACRIPVQSESVDAVAVGWGIRNVPDIDAALAEIFRVLKPGGKFVTLDMAIPDNPVVRWGSHLMCGKVLPALGSLFGQKLAYQYLPESAERFLTRPQLASRMEVAGFKNVKWHNRMLGNICLHVGAKP